MRKIVLGLTAAVAIGALAAPTIGSAASNHGSMGAGNAGGSRGNASVAVRSSSGPSVNANGRGTANVRAPQNVGINKNGPINGNAQRWSGQQWASSGRHHRHHRDRDFLFVPFAAYGDYAAYDYCWQSMWTPAGYQRVYVCEQNSYY